MEEVCLTDYSLDDVLLGPMVPFFSLDFMATFAYLCPFCPGAHLITGQEP